MREKQTPVDARKRAPSRLVQRGERRGHDAFAAESHELDHNVVRLRGVQSRGGLVREKHAKAPVGVAAHARNLARDRKPPLLAPGYSGVEVTAGVAADKRVPHA